jgi:hypothetical protein
MNRYILIDANSGLVWGEAETENPIEACRKVEATIYNEHQSYNDIGDGKFEGRDGYLVYLAPFGFPAVTDKTDSNTVVSVLPLAARIVTKPETTSDLEARALAYAQTAWRDQVGGAWKSADEWIEYELENEAGDEFESMDEQDALSDAMRKVFGGVDARG